VVNDHAEEEGAMPLINHIKEAITSMTSLWEKLRGEERMGR